MSMCFMAWIRARVKQARYDSRGTDWMQAAVSEHDRTARVPEGCYVEECELVWQPLPAFLKVSSPQTILVKHGESPICPSSCRPNECGTS